MHDWSRPGGKCLSNELGEHGRQPPYSQRVNRCHHEAATSRTISKHMGE